MKARQLLRSFCRSSDPPGVYRQPLSRADIDNRKVELDYHSTEPNSYYANGGYHYASTTSVPADEPRVYFDHVRKFSDEYRPWLMGHGGNGFFFFVYLFCWTYLFLYLRNEHHRRGKPRDRTVTFVN